MIQNSTIGLSIPFCDGNYRKRGLVCQENLITEHINRREKVEKAASIDELNISSVHHNSNMIIRFIT